MARYNEELRPRLSIAKAAAWVNPVSGEEAEDVKIRKAAAADAELIFGFLKDMRDEQARKRPDIVSKDEDILTLEEVAAAIEDPSKLVFVAENSKGEAVGQILCELEGEEETADAAETAEDIAVSAAEAADPVPAAQKPVTDEPAEEFDWSITSPFTEAEEAAKETAEAVAEAAEEAAGAALAPVKAAFAPKKLIIANIYVTDSARRQRIGTELYREACSEAKKLGCTGAELSCWQFDRDGILFFEKQGYKPLLVTMEKALGD